MKSFLLLSIFSLAVSLSAWINGGKEKLVMKTTTITLLLDDYVCSESQWVYLHGYKDWVSGNECTFFDSVFVSKGQHVVQLKAHIPEAQAVQVLFGKRGPSQMQLAVEPNSRLEVSVCEEDGDVSIFKRSEQGGSLNNRLHEFLKERLE